MLLLASKLGQPKEERRKDGDKRNGEVLNLGLDPVGMYPYRDKIQRKLDRKLCLSLLPKDSKTIALYAQYILRRMYPPSSCWVCEGLKNFVSFKEIWYLVELWALLIEEMGKERIAQAVKELQDYYNQQLGKSVVNQYKLLYVAGI